jgi:hypothetical protein
MALRRHDEAGTGRCVGGDDVENVAAGFSGDPAAGQRVGAVERAVENDADHGVKGIGRKFFGAGDKVAGGVVDQRVHVAIFGFGGVHQELDGSGVTDVAGGEGGMAAGGADFVSGFLEGLFAAAGEKKSRAELGEAQGHRAAQAGAATGDENDAVFQ